jgi:hypothetical protein
MTVREAGPEPAPAKLSRWRTLPKPATFWVTVALMVLFFYASSAPTASHLSSEGCPRQPPAPFGTLEARRRERWRSGHR